MRSIAHPPFRGISLQPGVAPRLLLLAAAYAAFVVYGSLIPFEYRPRGFDAALRAFQHIPYLRLGVASRADWVANILLYIPLAFLLTGAAASARSRAAKIAGTLAAIAFCLALAVAVEFAQLFFPPRTVSQNDLIAETIGTVLGVALWLTLGPRIGALASRVRAAGPGALRAAITLYVAAYLALSLFPFDFLVSAKELSAKFAGELGPAWMFSASCGGTVRCTAKLFAEIALAAPLGVFLGMLQGRRAPPRYGRAFLWGAVLGAVIEGLQLFLASGITQGLSIMTRGLGAAWGLAIYRSVSVDWFVRYRRVLTTAAWIAAPFYVVLLLVVKGLLPPSLDASWAAAEKLGELRFLPFYYHYFTTETEAMQSLLLNAGAYLPVGLLAWIAAPPVRSPATRWLAAIAGAGLALAVETLTLFTIGKRPDPTNVLIAGATCYIVVAVLQWVEAGVLATGRRSVAAEAPPAAPARGLAMKLTTGLVVVAVAVGGLVVATPHREKYVDESTMHRLPRGVDLPPVDLPRFRLEHPRLPHPTPEEIETLRQRNPGFLAAVKRGAGARRNPYPIILAEFIEPGTQDVDELVHRLLRVKYDWRGHDQANPIVLAYDWLYPRLTEAQRAALRDKVAEGCNYLIEVIRQERLSPYNVILYNAPFQALVACAIALYRDDPRGEPVMRFTYDLWKNRVLPVWRQVMGRGGGWHEGGEYFGIGIGNAVYRVPAMWRLATGEDIFATEPGIRGFLDFAVYRTQPDGQHFRWGDASSFDRIVSDVIPLALEFQHSAAYSLRRPAREPTPSSWPWGPLTDDKLFDPEAAKRLPLVRFFDGLGMIVARSDWSPDATYVTFKAGDNYWSHSHLDQGAFTIYKGGHLALDSGVYGPFYGSDHHLNYAYQAIAHNTITVTDPADNVPAPGKDSPRPIANDGGQRRVGSGWGVEPAPLDLAEWEVKRDIYHTGRIARLVERDGVTVAISDLTAAYTNPLSGKGTFSHRTRRVEQFRRVFGYDRVDDVIVVFDSVRSTRSSFRKRWLLHTVEAPVVGKGRFSVSIASTKQRGHGGGRLEGHVLFPVRSTLSVIGGPGFEFYVDGRNYDENGKLNDFIQRRPAMAPGAWRIELTPDDERLDDQFLVVMLPSPPDRAPAHAVSRIVDGARVGCEVVGPARVTRWLFDTEQGLVSMTVTPRPN